MDANLQYCIGQSTYFGASALLLSSVKFHDMKKRMNSFRHNLTGLEKVEKIIYT